MISNTKIHLDKKTILELTKLNISSDDVLEIIELKDGWFNTAYLIEFVNEFSCVLKVGPPIDADIMNYEINMMASEVACLKLVSSNIKIPSPKILFSDLSRSVIQYQYFFMDYLEGKSWDKLKSKLSDHQNNSISHQLGELTAAINSYESDFFGYFNLEPKFEMWYETFRSMCLFLFKDALKYKVLLPINESTFLSVLSRYKSSFDEVKKAKLIHWDLSGPNIIIRKLSENNYSLTGVIDFERALWADPLMENILFDINNKNKAYFEGYKHNLLTTANQTIRRIFYNMYLCLIMVIEDGPRNYDDKSSVTWAFTELKKNFKLLNDQNIDG
ncbi:MAG: aminoglycoside phosphotransferase family protein [Saccharospirillaceae bacterium]|nr:aminoglycoside phosphotransferase family protein [Pseudomonadales bacterium]NRB77523.1 aminoglycoside phosphotransferase family protein [Saccharospirillaceae bacterium]